MNNDEKRATVLIVDDLKFNIELMGDLLCDSFDIRTANSGFEALDIIRSDPKAVDVILLDMIMPRMNGCEFLEQMKSEPEISGIPVIIVTTDDDPYIKLRAFDLGAMDFVQRGADVTVIKHRINNVLRLTQLERLIAENARMSVENEQMKKAANNEHRFTAFMDNIPGGVAVIRTNGTDAECSYFNKELLLLFGMTPEEFKAQFTDTYRPEWIKTFIREEGYSAHFSFTFAVGDPAVPESCQWIRLIAGNLGETDGTADIYCVFLDGNDEKRHEMLAKEAGEKLRENEDKLEALLDNSPGGIVYAERDSYGKMNVLFVNRGLAEMLEYPTYESCIAELSADATVGLTAYDVSVIRKKLEETLETGGHLKHSFNVTTKNGRTIWLTLRAKPMLNTEGTLCLYIFITNTTKEKKIEDELRTVAYYDPLTELYNRSAFIKNAREKLDENPMMEYSMMKLNIGSFKTVNDLMGRELGDKVLCMVANVLREVMGGSGIYARFFADNFCMLVPYSERSVHPQMILDALKKAMKGIPEITHEIQFYLGVYKITDKSLSIDNMTDRASIACRSINGSYREHIAYYDEKMRLRMLEEQEICDESRRALDNGEFYICYQPVYGIRARKFVSAEALVRWNHPKKGMIPPGKFIPVFEKNGFIAELDLYILEQVCIYQKKRVDSGLEPFPISVNISRMSMYNPRLYDIINDLTMRYHVDPKNFRIEITESAYNDNPAQLLETVGRLRGNCFPVLMDDFGSGYSSLNTLKDIPIDILKLDMQFMQGFEKNGKVGTIVTSIARMSKWLNIPMLAEGVETREQYEFLASIGCAYIQGFYFSRPVPEAEFTMLIEQEEVVGVSEKQPDDVTIGYDVNELLGSNPLVSKFIDSVCGGLGIYELVDGRLELIRANGGYMQIMGYSAQDSLAEGTNIWDYVHADDVEASRNACMQAVKTDKAVRATVRRYAKNGRLLTLEGIHRKLGGTEESPIFCIAFTDITDRIKSDRYIEQSNSRAEELMNATGSLFIDIDFENDTVYHTGSYLPFGMDVQHSADYSKIEELCRENTHPDDLAKLERFKQNQSDKRYSDELRMKNRDGEYHWWRFTHVRTFDDSGKLTRLIAIVTLIDVEKSAQQELERMRGTVTEAVDNFDNGVVVLRVSKQGEFHITYSNDSFWKIVGRKRAADSEFMKTMISVVSPEDHERIVAHIESGSKESLEFTATREDGTAARIDLRYAISENPDIGERVLVCFFANITEKYEARIRINSILDSYSGGIAFINTENGAKVEYANDNFYSLLSLSKEDETRLSMIVNEIIDSDVQSSDIRIRRNHDSRVIRARVFPAGENALVLRVNDVTRKRSELKDRINERMENAAAGLYDMVFELNLRAKTVRLVSTRKEALNNAMGRPMPVDAALRSLSKKIIFPKDVECFREIFEMPFVSPDFTDAYREVRFLDPEANGKYILYGITIVRAKTDSCMLFCRDKARVDNLVANSKLADLSRLYRIVADRAKITVIEWDHVTNRMVCSPSIEEFWAAKLSAEDFYDRSGEGFMVHDDDKKLYREYYERVTASSGTNERATLRLKMADESYKWCELSIVLTRASNGSVLRSLCIIKQLDRDSAEQNRRDKGIELLSRTVANIPVGLGIFRLENGKAAPVYISDKIYEIFGIRSRNMDVPFLPLDSLARKNGLNTGTEGSFVVESMKADGKRFDLGISYNVAEEDGETLIYAIFSDITEQLDNRRRSTAENEMYSMLLYETGTIIFNYNTTQDKLTYSTHEDGKPNAVEVLSDFLRQPERLTFIGADDLGKFTRALVRLRSGEEHEEFPVRVEVDGYPRRYKVFMKNIRDEENKIFSVIGKMEDVDDELTRLEKVEAKAMFDPLCVDVYNRSTTEELIKAELERGTGGVLMMLDIDDFKSINDTLGHLFGDEFLKRFATTIKSVFRQTDIVGRYGGDEFIVFLPRATASLAKKKGRHILERVLEIDVPKLGGIKSSIGAAVVNPADRSYSELFRQADTALYQAKNKGKNRVEMYDAASMSEGTYRTNDPDGAAERAEGGVALSSNPSGASSLMMRVFSALYSSADIDAGISQMLELLGRTFDVSRVYIFEDSEDGRYCSNTFEWCSEGKEPVIDTLQHVDYEKDLGGKYLGCFNDDGIIYCQDIAELPAEVGAFLEEQGVKSVLHCSILDAGRFKGFLGFDECRNNRFWTQEQVDSLVFLSKIISVFLMKGRKDQKTEKKESLT